MAVARRVFEGANETLVSALRKAGLPCEQFLGGVFQASIVGAPPRLPPPLFAAMFVTDLRPPSPLPIPLPVQADPQLGLVGEIKSVRAEGVNAAIAGGKIPVLTSLGVHLGQEAAGGVLNINADVAARELAIALQPLKVVFISAGGGWKEEGKGAC